MFGEVAMRRTCIWVLAVFFILCGSPLWAQDKDYVDSEEHPGMEEKRVGDARVVAPKDARMYKHGDLLVLESSGEYAARKLLEVDNRLARLEEENLRLRKEINEMRNELDEVKKNSKASKK